MTEGDRVAADGRLVQAAELRVNQSTLSGEADAVRKTANAVTRTDLATVEMPNLVFAGTSVVAGTGQAVVVATGNGTDPHVLEAAGIRRADLVAAVTGADETNLVVTSLARQEFNVHRVIARVNNPKNAWLFTPEMGCDVAVNQAEVMAKLIIEGM